MELRKSDLEYDYLKFTGEMIGFDFSTHEHKSIVTHFLEEKGYVQKKHGNDWVYYENQDCGMKAFISNFPMNNRIIGKSPSITLEFTGHFFIRNNADLLARKIITYFTRKFGTFFKVNRVDIRQDIYGARYPFDYLPDWTIDKNNLVWALRGKPKQNLFNHSMSSTPTGLSISTSRYKIMSYNRNMALKDRFRSGEITKSYYDYYRKIYKNNDVQRLEIQLKQDACNLFTILFFKKDYDKEKALKYTMANFGRNHALKNYEPGVPIHKMKTNEIFEELFYLDQKKSLKIFKEEFQHKAGIKMSDICFSPKGRSINEIVKMLGKKICELSNGEDGQRRDILQKSIKALKIRTEEFKEVISDRKNACMKTFSAMNFDLEELMRARESVLECGSIPLRR